MINGVYVRSDGSVWSELRVRLVSIDDVNEFGVLKVTLENIITKERKSDYTWQIGSWVMIASPVPYARS